MEFVEFVIMPTARHQAPASAASCGRTTHGKKGLLAFLFNLRFLRIFQRLCIISTNFRIIFLPKINLWSRCTTRSLNSGQTNNRKTDRSVSRRPRGAPTGRVPRRGPPFREDCGQSSWCSKPKALIDGQPFPTDVLF